MKNRHLQFLVLFASLSLGGCKKEIQTFTIIREPLVSFQIGRSVALSTNTARFFGGATSIHTYPNNAQQAFNRFVLQTDGTDNLGRRYNMQFEVDVLTNGDYVGIYRPVYNPAIGGLADFRFTIQDGSRFIEYGLAPGDIDAFVQVQGQSPDEQIIKGVFAATLMNRSDTTAADIEINVGTFIDIPF